MTGQQLVNAAMTLIGCLTQGESPSSTESADVLKMASDMLASWSVERLNVFTVGSAAYNLVSGTAGYTIGTGGTFNAARPVRYEKAAILLPNAGASGNMVHPMEIVDFAAWSEILERGAKAVAPRILYPDMAFPLTTLNLWPTPTFSTITPQIELWTWTALTDMTVLGTDYTFPPGYDRALKFNLAVEISAAFGVVPSPQVIQTAAESKAALRMLNMAAPGAVPTTGQISAIAPVDAGVAG